MQPGQFNPKGEDWIGREFAELRKEIRELRAANPYAPMGMEPVSGGVTIRGNFTLDGGDLRAVSDNGDIFIDNNEPTPGSPLVPFIKFAWKVAGTTQTNPAYMYGAEDRLIAVSPRRDGYANYGSINLADTYFNFGIRDKATQTAAGPIFFGKETGQWYVGDERTGKSRAGGNQDGSWSLGQNSSEGASIAATAGSAAVLVLSGGPTGGAVQVVGNTTVYGNHSITGTKSFVMPHPTREGMELQHASTESPVNGVEYWGEGTFNDQGEATVTLPDYFEALTKQSGRNVQITPIGRVTVPASADRIAEGKFTAYGQPGAAFCWHVKAERHHIIDGADVLAFEPEH